MTAVVATATVTVVATTAMLEMDPVDAVPVVTAETLVVTTVVVPHAKHCDR